MGESQILWEGQRCREPLLHPPEKTLRSHGRPKSNITVPDATQRRSGRIAGTLALAASVSSGEVRHRRLDAPYNSLLLFRAGRRVIEDLTHPTTCGRVECSVCLRVGSRLQCLSLHSPLMASRRGIRILCITLTTERLSRRRPSACVGRANLSRFGSSTPSTPLPSSGRPASRLKEQRLSFRIGREASS